MPLGNVVIKTVSTDDVKRLHELETEGYPGDEAASLDMLIYRHREAPALTLAYFLDDVIIGFISATRYHGSTLTAESLTTHVPSGTSVCIHSVVVSEQYRRQGIALKLLASFTERVKKEEEGARRILLVCKSNLIPLYTRAGFVLHGKSALVHGQDAWYELGMDLCAGS